MKIRNIPFLILFFCVLAFPQDESEEEKKASDVFEKGLELRYSQKDSAYYYLDLATKYYLELRSYPDALDVLLESIFSSGIHYDLKRYKNYLDEMDSLLHDDSVRKSVENLQFYKNRFIYEVGSYLSELGDHNGAKPKFQYLYDTFSKKKTAEFGLDDVYFLVYSSNYLASIYMDLGKYDLAESYFNRSLIFIEKNRLAQEEGLDRATNRLLAKLYITMGKHQKANTILTELLDSYKTLYEKDKEHKNNVVVVYQRLVDNLMQQDSLKKALSYLDESREYLLAEDPFYKESILLYGDIYAKLNQGQKALEHYKNALDFFEDYRQYKAHQDIARVQGKIAELHLKNEDHREGLIRIKKALNSAGSNIDISNSKENPDPTGVFSKTQLLHLLDIKLQLLAGMLEKTNETGYLNAAVYTDRDILETFDYLKKEFDSKLDKQFLVEKAYPIFHRMLEMAHTAYEKNPSAEILQLALNIAEKNKDFLLLEALRGTQASQYGNVPQKVLDKEARLRAEITHFEKEIFDATEDDSGFSDDLFKIKQQYYGFLDTIKIKYPKYHELKYQSTSLDLATVRNKVLEDAGTLVSYTVTDEYLYAIILNGSKENFLKLSFSDADLESVREFYRVLSRPSIGESNKDISELGKSLYDKILRKPLEGFDSENLTIIPDGELHYLPFDLLQEDGSYLLETATIGYGNSLISLLELKNKKPADQNRLLAFAPAFDNAVVEELPEEQTRQLGKLTYNDDEVNGIENLYDADIFMADRATLTNFKKNAPRFNVIHLATHASANDEYPDYSYLAFSKNKDSSQSNILYIKDLYNTSLNADMVTLSACQTGIGKLQKGQGMLSLSKGFYYAGAKSLVNTLWKINDKSSVKLMEFFYEGLSEGKSKTAALRDAKLKYLKTTDDNLLKHPYYWAAFVVSGNISAISTDHYYWEIGIGILFFGILFFLSKRKEASEKGKCIYL